MNVPTTTSSWSSNPAGGLVVGTVHSESSFRAARALPAPPAAPDLLELRVDHFAAAPQALTALLDDCARGVIVTVRDAGEGGHGQLDLPARQALYERFLPFAHYVDLELSSLPGLPSIAAQARRTGGGLIASHHDFLAMPSLARLRALAGQAADAGAALFKVAARVERPEELTALLEFLGTEKRLPLAVMGMGRFGRISRLAAAACGSRLNYGYLGDAAQVPGQWPAAVLRARIDELWQDAPPASGLRVPGRAE